MATHDPGQASGVGRPPWIERAVFVAMIAASGAAFAVTASKDPVHASAACALGLGALPWGSLSAQTLAPCLQEPDLAVFLAYDWLFIAAFVLTGCLAVRQCAAAGRRTSPGRSRRLATVLGRWGALIVTLYFAADSAENLLLISRAALSWGWLLAVCSTVKWVGAFAMVFLILAGCWSLTRATLDRQREVSGSDDVP